MPPTPLGYLVEKEEDWVHFWTHLPIHYWTSFMCSVGKVPNKVAKASCALNLFVWVAVWKTDYCSTVANPFTWKDISVQKNSFGYWTIQGIVVFFVVFWPNSSNYSLMLIIHISRIFCLARRLYYHVGWYSCIVDSKKIGYFNIIVCLF